MIDKVMSDTAKNSRGEVNAVLDTLYALKEAFPRQCPKLVVEAFIECPDPHVNQLPTGEKNGSKGAWGDIFSKKFEW